MEPTLIDQQRPLQNLAWLCASVLVLAGCDYQSETGEARTYDVPTGEDTAGAAVRSVQIGFDGPRFAACASYGEITNLSSNGEDMLSVRAAPSSSTAETDQLPSGSGVAMCQKVGGWVGIVYPPPVATVEEGAEADELLNCATGSPVPNARDYEGPCRSGWVREEYIRLMGSQS